MKFVKYILAGTIFFLIMGFSQNLFSWGIFNLFNDKNFSAEGIEKVENFNPDTDILYLPEVGEKNIFDAIKDLSICRNKEVRRYIYLYLTTGREYSIKAIERSYLYYDIIMNIFKKNEDIPNEIALLPLLESGFNPYAVSRSRAVGLWQFVRNTSRPLGLKRDSWIDERRDIEKSTEAAIRHLRHLYDIFHSWELALVAYNGGAGHVSRAIKKSGTKDIWGLLKSGALNKETNEYLPRFIALVLIYNNQRLFNIYDEITVPEKHDTENFVLKYPVNINKVSKISGVPSDVIKRYNPELKKNIIPPYYNDYMLRIPSEAKQILEEKEKELYENRFTRIIKHIIKKGECLSIIARRYKKKLRTLSHSTA